MSSLLLRISKAAPLRLAALLLVTSSASACVFLDDDGSEVGEIRGYTSCGDFLGGVECAPGQFCSDPQWSECSTGCLSDVNCASNQACVKYGSSVGYCDNVYSSTRAAVTFTPDAGIWPADAGR